MIEPDKKLTRELAEEEAFFDAFERGDIPFRSTITPQRREEVQAMARAAISEERERISLRVPRTDLQRLKSKAIREGVPYQTLINSLIHKYVSE